MSESKPHDDPPEFIRRHIGPSAAELQAMLDQIGVSSLDQLIDETLPSGIRSQTALEFDGFASEHEALAAMRALASQNVVAKDYLGTGYYPTITPSPILRNILENPGWYTQYTPYQAEISQGRLEALLNFQTMVGDLCGLPVANASLLDEGTAAAEAMAMAWGLGRKKKNGLFVSDACHPQTIAVIQTRAQAIGIDVHVGDAGTFAFGDYDLFAGVLQYPATDGAVQSPQKSIERLHAEGAKAIVASDLLALCLLVPPGELGADIVIGSSQRFGVPMGFGGPHAAFLATKSEYARQVPGRIVGVSKDATDAPALRLAMQTREQHIRREKATSNICTAQVLLAIMASTYAVYHGPEGLKRIAMRVHRRAASLAEALRRRGVTLVHAEFFDTVRFRANAADILARAHQANVNLRAYDDGTLSVSLNECTTEDDIAQLIHIVTTDADAQVPPIDEAHLPRELVRQTEFLTHPVFHRHQSETKLMRYLHTLEAKDLSLNAAMIPLGSCTMKLNAATELMPLSWPEFSNLHPFAPLSQATGYLRMFEELEILLARITGFDAVSLQPNAGSQGEYAGLLAIRGYFEGRGESHRNVCLIPQSAHGTNPASAVMAGMKVVVVACDDQGNIDLEDLKAKTRTHADKVAALMVTYPSTHGVFEETIVEVCRVVHDAGGQVYMDGANLNAKVGLARPGDVGADVCHLNLHKTFAIPHGGGGPGMGPIAVATHLAPFLPSHPAVNQDAPVGPVAAAPWGSPSILTISYLYIKMMGARGLTDATKVAIANANYMASRLEAHYPILFRGKNDRVAHEFILDLRPLKQSADVTVDDVAKRLMDYGFHAPTMSWPVAGTIMVEPTESEAKDELDRFCDAMIQIRQEIANIENGTWPQDNNPLKHAPHTSLDVTRDDWDRPYSRQTGAFPTDHQRAFKYWPPVARVDNAFGDRNFVCSCPPLEAYD